MADDDIDGDRTHETGDRSNSVRDAHQNTGVPGRDVQMVYVESYKKTQTF